MDKEKIKIGISNLWDYAQRIRTDAFSAEFIDELIDFFKFAKEPQNRKDETLKELFLFSDYILSLEDLIESDENFSIIKIDKNGNDIENKSDENIFQIYCDCYNIALEINDWGIENFPHHFTKDKLNVYTDLNENQNLNKFQIKTQQIDCDFLSSTIKINNAFYRLENFMNGTLNDYQYFGFNDAFTNIFKVVIKPENYTFENCKLIGEYWSLTEQIRIDYDKSDFENTDAYQNEMFCKDCEEIMHLNWERIDEFLAFSTPDEISESARKFSITDILKKTPVPLQQAETKTYKPKAPVLGLFCSLINKIGIDKKEESESATVYCERICNKFKLPYTDRVRQNYNVKETKKLKQELIEKVLQLIDNETKISVQKYLDSKQPPNPSLYG